MRGLNADDAVASSHGASADVDQELIEIEALIELRERRLQLLRKRRTSSAATPPEQTQVQNPVSPEATGGGGTRKSRWMPSFGRPANADEEQSSEISKITRLNRLGTELANERTLLAWTRTSLATVRTVFSLFSFAGVTAAGGEFSADSSVFAVQPK